MERPNRSKNDEKSLFPDIEIYNTFQDLLSGNNSVMEYILTETKK